MLTDGVSSSHPFPSSPIIIFLDKNGKVFRCLDVSVNLVMNIHVVDLEIIVKYVVAKTRNYHVNL